MLISKKELLEKTHISYGQLYRWKREGLIPDDWFVKQSSYTGQETFFESEQILARIHLILELKDNYSLDEIRSKLTRVPDEGLIPREDIYVMSEIDGRAIELYNYNEYSYYELVLLYITSSLLCEKNEPADSVKELVANISPYFSSEPDTGRSIVILKENSTLLGMIIPEKGSLLPDKRTRIIAEYRLDEIFSNLKLKYGKK